MININENSMMFQTRKYSEYQIHALDYSKEIHTCKHRFTEADTNQWTIE